MLASRTSCTNIAQAGSFVGTGAPLEQLRPALGREFIGLCNRAAQAKDQDKMIDTAQAL